MKYFTQINNMAAENNRYNIESGENKAKPNTVREEYKRYKKRSPPPDLSDVIDFENPSTFAGRVREFNVLEKDVNCRISGLHAVTKWKVFEVVSCPGFLFIVNPFKRGVQHYFVQRSLKNFPCKPNATNLVIHDDVKLDEGQSFWEYW